MKGMTLPITAVVAIAIVSLVLLVVGAFFAGTGGSTMSSIEARRVFDNGCRALEAQCRTNDDPYVFAASLCGDPLGISSSEFGPKYLQACRQLGYVSEAGSRDYCIDCLRRCDSVPSCNFEITDI